MKIVSFILSIFLMTAITADAQDGTATTIKKTFSRTTTVSTLINASLDEVWGLLTDAKTMENWNSTIISISGEIKEGEKIVLRTTLDSSRTFKLKVKEITPQQMMVWGDAMGKRIYLLETTENGIRFTMTEKIGGIMFPLFAKKIPSFDSTFEQFARDLKQTAESLP